MPIYDFMPEEAQPFTVGWESILLASPGFVLADPETTRRRVFITDITIDTDSNTEVVLYWLGGSEIFRVTGANAHAELHGVCIPAPVVGAPLWVFGDNAVVANVGVSGFFWNGGAASRPNFAKEREWAWLEDTMATTPGVSLATADAHERIIVTDIYADTLTNTELVFTWGSGGTEFARIAGTARHVQVGGLQLVSEAKGQDVFVVGSGAAGHAGLGYRLFQQHGASLPDDLARRFHTKVELAGNTGTPAYATVFNGSSGGEDCRYMIDRAWLDCSEGADEATLLIADDAAGSVPLPIAKAYSGEVKEFRGLVGSGLRDSFALVRNVDAATAKVNAIVEGYRAHLNQ